MVMFFKKLFLTKAYINLQRDLAQSTNQKDIFNTGLAQLVLSSVNSIYDLNLFSQKFTRSFVKILQTNGFRAAITKIRVLGKQNFKVLKTFLNSYQMRMI